ncbi:cyclophilin-like domain-containing protein [Blastocladiella britannica]|nr:cyclophilin-like domain-containing protein [Blastocladiella britannica]
MSVLIETSLGEIVVDLDVAACPQLARNFIKLAKLKRFNYNAFFNVQRDLLVQTGDPTASGTGGAGIEHVLDPSSHPPLFAVTDRPRGRDGKPRRHDRPGLVSMAVAGIDAATGRGGVASSQWFITAIPESTTDSAADDRSAYLDARGVVFGEVAEGMDVVAKMNAAFTDEQGRPLRDIRIHHTEILDDPFPDPPALRVPSRSPSPPPEAVARARLGADEALTDDDDADADPDTANQKRRRRDAASHALALELLGDLPFADIKPPENVLFVCKLNPVTRDEDLEQIFGRFGAIVSCQVIRDRATNVSLSYAFIEYDERDACERAYAKMNNVLIDDRRIKVDFSQSVSKLHKDWMVGRARSLASAKGTGGGFGGFAEFERKTRYRAGGDDGFDEVGATASMVDDHGDRRPLPPPPLVFEHDADLLESGREVAADDAARETVEMVPLSPPRSVVGSDRSRRDADGGDRRRSDHPRHSAPPPRNGGERDRDHRDRDRRQPSDRDRERERERDRDHRGSERRHRDHRREDDDGRGRRSESYSSHRQHRR